MAFILSHAGVGAVGFAGGRAPADFASSSSIGAPRLHEWIDITAAHLSTKRVSSLDAPASSALRMCLRVPSGFRFVHAALSATPISSISLRDSTPERQGL